MATTKEVFQCGWDGCPDEFDLQSDWVDHVSIHVFTLKPNERTPWLGPPELDPDRRCVSVVDDGRSDGEDEDEDEGGRAFSQTNALSSPASTPPQVELPDSPNLSEKINGPSASLMTTVEPLRLLHSPNELERALSYQTSGSADDVEAELIPVSPTPSTNASQNASSNQESYQYILSHPSPIQTQSQFPSVNVNRFRRGTFRISAQAPLRSGLGMNTPQSQDRLTTSQTLRSPDGSRVSAPVSQSQTIEDGMSQLMTQAFRPPETQDSYESDQ